MLRDKGKDIPRSKKKQSPFTNKFDWQCFPKEALQAALHVLMVLPLFTVTLKKAPQCFAMSSLKYVFLTFPVCLPPPRDFSVPQN